MPNSPDTAPYNSDMDDPPNAWLELQACLDVLGDLLDHHADPLEHGLPDLDEQLTAYWQTIELVMALGQENDAAWKAVDGLRVIVNELQGQVADERKLWKPGL